MIVLSVNAPLNTHTFRKLFPLIYIPLLFSVFLLLEVYRDALMLASSSASLGCVNYIVKNLSLDDVDAVDENGAGCVHRVVSLQLLLE